MLVTLQQALSSGYLNSVITTIEKRYEIPSSISGIVASMYEIGNVGTVIFVSYLGSRRHIPTWIGMGEENGKMARRQHLQETRNTISVIICCVVIFHLNLSERNLFLFKLSDSFILLSLKSRERKKFFFLTL
jgi:hypothetical protein